MNTLLKTKILLLLVIPFFSFAQETSYDSDGDGIPDSTDECMLVKGVAAYKGCPYAKKISATDRDGDGLKDVQDQCPDMFGLAENKGCPVLKQETPSQQEGSLAPNNSLFTTVSSLSKEEDDAFNQILMRIVSDSSKPFTTVSTEPYTGDTKTSCLPGALQCYIKDDKKTFYADFGTYSGEKPAAEKYYLLRKKLAEALNEKDWEGMETSAGGYIDKYQLTKRGGSLHSPVITTHVQKRNDTYAVYITIEQK